MSRQRGFTLVEVLVGLSVATLLFGLVYGTVRLGHRSASGLNDQVTENEVMRIGWQFLHDAISRARPMPRIERGAEQNVTGFAGDHDVLKFVADMPSYAGLGGLMTISLGIETHAGTSNLVLSRQRFDRLGRNTDDATLERAVLVEDLDKLQVRYFGKHERDDQPDWFTRWQDLPTLPNLIEISVQPSDKPAWPLLIARPSAGTSTLEDWLPDQDTPVDEAAEPEVTG